MSKYPKQMWMKNLYYLKSVIIQDFWKTLAEKQEELVVKYVSLPNSDMQSRNLSVAPHIPFLKLLCVMRI